MNDKASLIPLPQTMTKAAITARGAELAEAILDSGDVTPGSPGQAAGHPRRGGGRYRRRERPTMTQAEQWDEGPGRGVSVLGVGIRLSNGAARWDYSHDPVWGDENQ